MMSGNADVEMDSIYKSREELRNSAYN